LGPFTPGQTFFLFSAVPFLMSFPSVRSFLQGLSIMISSHHVYLLGRFSLGETYFLFSEPPCVPSRPVTGHCSFPSYGGPFFRVPLFFPSHSPRHVTFLTYMVLLYTLTPRNPLPFVTLFSPWSLRVLCFHLSHGTVSFNPPSLCPFGSLVVPFFLRCPRLLPGTSSPGEVPPPNRVPSLTS